MVLKGLIRLARDQSLNKQTPEFSGLLDLGKKGNLIRIKRLQINPVFMFYSNKELLQFRFNNFFTNLLGRGDDQTV